MKNRFATFALLASCLGSPAWAAQTTPATKTDLDSIAPALGYYTTAVIDGDLWKRPELSLRDRSMATVSALIATGQTDALTAELVRALDNGVKPVEIGAIITHLAFYAGWPNALSAVAIAKPIFAARNINAEQLTGMSDELRPVDEKADQQRAAGVERSYGAVSPSIVRYTNSVLFGDVWRRQDLSLRDRSLVTISALIAGNHTVQLSSHLSRGMDNGLTKKEIGEVITQLAFYVGWPSALSAIPVAQAAFEKRPS